MTSPFRDENASLRAENERLRASRAPRSSRGRLAAAMGLVALDFVLAMTLRPWFNGGGDAKFWGALGLVVGLLVVAIAFGARR